MTAILQCCQTGNIDVLKDVPLSNNFGYVLILFCFPGKIMRKYDGTWIGFFHLRRKF